MNRDEILALCRNEMKNKDFAENELWKNATSTSSLIAFILATFFICFEIFVDKGLNFGMYAIASIIPVTNAYMHYKRNKDKKELITLILFGIMLISSTILELIF